MGICALHFGVFLLLLQNSFGAPAIYSIEWQKIDCMIAIHRQRRRRRRRWWWHLHLWNVNATIWCFGIEMRGSDTETELVQCRDGIAQSKNVSAETECNRDKFKLRNFDTSNVCQKTVNMYFDKQRANAIWTVACWQTQSSAAWIHLLCHIIESICWICDFIVCAAYTHTITYQCS